MTATAVMNLKGGPGKTFVVGGLAHAHAAKAEAAAASAAADTPEDQEGNADDAVLIGDMDPQGNTTRHMTGYHIKNVPPTGTMADVLDRRVSTELPDVVLPAKTRDRIFVAPSGFDQMQEVQDTLLGQTGGELSVRKAFKAAKSQGRVLFDTRPAVDLVTRATMLASDNLVIVVTPELDAIDGMLAVFKALEDLEKHMDYVLPLVGVVVNQVDGSRNDHAQGLDYIRSYCANAGIQVLGQPFPRAADISRLTNAGLGMDQHTRPTAKSRFWAENFAIILDAIDKEAAA
ncbi:ParA family protein [Nocardia salmonicida]|uniref:ParA family protein n=1 Tax=Nocardia salmonicida TaxID=53431 RepID=UPI000A4651ED|nr:ParA family protein [Nocardia salmonicida]